ncbi:MAG: GAF domain-containing protein [Solirubrobacteraceae bacterium]|nr:GAF domain-containing protein [Solirubrobacteraceae bacterium]
MGLGVGALAAAVLAAGSGPTLGANVTAYQPEAYRTPVAERALDRLRDTGMDDAAVVVTWYMDDARSSTVAPDPGLTPSDDSVERMIREARGRGLRVALKPHVDVRDGTFRGEIAPADRAAWWAAYTRMVERYADLAARAGAEILVVGTELRSMSGDQDAFREVVARARSRFDGALTYAANWDEVGQVRFWDALDAIGVDAYYPLASAPGATAAQLRAAWRPIVRRLERLSDRWDRPLALTEIGYAARPDAAVDPSGAGASPGPYDPGAQAVAYEAALDAWRDSERLAAIWWWDWPADPRDAVGDAYTARDRPAEAVLRAFTDEEGGGGPVASIPWSLLMAVAIWILVPIGFLLIVRRLAGRRAGPETPPAVDPPAAPAPAATDEPDAPDAPEGPGATEAETASEPLDAAAAAPRARDARFSRAWREDLRDLGRADLDRLCRLACEVLDVEMAVVLVRAPDDPDSLVTAGQSGVDLRGRRWPADAGVAGMVLAGGEPVSVSDYSLLSSRIGPKAAAGLRAGAAAPVVVRHAVRGSLSIGTRDAERRFDDRDLELVGALAELVASAIARPGGPDELEDVRAQLRGVRAALDARDPDEHLRIATTVGFAARLGRRLLPEDPRLHAELALAARLHDVGMLRVPSASVRAATSGDDPRLARMHPVWGCELLAEIPGLQTVAAIVRFHGERWDGGGVPHGLAEERIPLASRIIAVARAWSEMTTDEAEPRSPEHALHELREAAGGRFDPRVVEVAASVGATMPRPAPRPERPVAG